MRGGGLGGDLEASLQPPEARGPALDDFCNFSIKITHFLHISANILVLKQYLIN